MGKQLVNIITYGCESSARFFVIYKAERESTPYWLKAVALSTKKSTTKNHLTFSRHRNN
jgi:hypothetical protein